jgi:hypothetical protein
MTPKETFFKPSGVIRIKPDFINDDMSSVVIIDSNDTKKGL